MAQGNDLNCVIDLLKKDGTVQTRQFAVPDAASCIANGTIPVNIGEAQSAQTKTTDSYGKVVPAGSGTVIKDPTSGEVVTNRLDGARMTTTARPAPAPTR